MIAHQNDRQRLLHCPQGNAWDRKTSSSSYSSRSTMIAQRHQPVECTTIDGIILRGWLYTVPGPAPGIIMTHGVRAPYSLEAPLRQRLT